MSGEGRRLGSDEDARAQALQELQQLSGQSEERCIEYLEAANWDFARAAQAFYLDNEDQPADDPPADTYTGPRTLDGRPAPSTQSASSSQPKKAPPAKKRTGLATLSSISSAGPAGHDDDDEDDDMYDENDGRNPRDLFAGGEKSGLAVHDPHQEGGGTKKLISDILAKAKANTSRPDGDSQAGPSRAGAFRGTGQTLGGDGEESRVIPNPNAFQGPGGASGSGADSEPQERVLHLWRDGFSVDHGELRRFDDPENAADLSLIRAGRAPLHLMNIRYDQPVDVKLQQHEENYRPLPRAYKPFDGTGRRLGSEVPGDSTTSTPAQPSAPAAAAPAAATPSNAPPSTEAVDSLPTLTLRIQLPDGTRLPARFNTTQTLDAVYDFIQRASPDVQSRPWVVATTFPNKEHTDRSLVLGDMPEFKKGGTAVVKWA